MCGEGKKTKINKHVSTFIREMKVIKQFFIFKEKQHNQIDRKDCGTRKV